MIEEVVYAADCSCQSNSHDHAPGACPRIRFRDDGLCEVCHESADADTRPKSGGYSVGGFGVGTWGGGADGPAFGFAETVEVGLTGVEARAELGSLNSIVEVGLKGVEAKAEIGSPRPPAERITLNWQEPIVGTPNMGEENDTVEARARITHGTITIDDTLAISTIWNSRSPNIILQIDSAAQELEAVRLLLLTLQANGAADSRGHNNPPGLLGTPDVDIEAIEAAIQCLVVLRSLVSQPKPDFQIVTLLWRVVLTALRAMGKLVAWAAQTTKSIFEKFLDTTFGKSFTKAFGATLGASAACGIVYGITQHGPQGLQAVEGILKGVLAALGHPIQ
jgi:hypothetical protein